MGAGAFGAADYGAEVVRVGNLVADDDEGLLAALGGDVEDVVDAGVLAHGADGDDALVGVGDAHGVELAPVAVGDGDAAVAGQTGDVSEGAVGLAAGDVYFVDGAPGAERLLHRVAALDDVVSLLVHVMIPPQLLTPHDTPCGENLQAKSSAHRRAKRV